MTHYFEDTEGVHAIDQNAERAAYVRTGLESGCGVTFADDSSAIVTDVDAGTALFAGSSTSVAAQSVTLADGDSDHPRVDALYVDDTGTVQVAEGDPAPWDPDRDTDGDGVNERTAVQTHDPSPPSLDGLMPDVVVIATVGVPARQTESSSLVGEEAALITDRSVDVPEVTGLTQSTADDRYAAQDGSGNTWPAYDAARVDGLTPEERLIAEPNAPVEAVLLQQGESISIMVPVDDGEVLTVYSWGVYTVSNRDAPTGLEVQLLDETDAVTASANTTRADSTSGVASWTNNSGAREIYRLRINNDTGTDYDQDGVAGHFAYRVA